MLGPTPRSQVWLANRAEYFSIARRQWGSTRVARTGEGIEEAAEAETVVRTNRSTRQRMLVERRVTIRWTWPRSRWMATGWYTEGST
jgi:hypothetical protein